jgi:hypothetical protein
VCIKTDYVNNIYWAIQNSKWAAMDKVGARIMRLWDQCREKGERILFLFSVNGAKSYCGIAEMNGPYKFENDLHGWEYGKDRMVQFG